MPLFIFKQNGATDAERYLNECAQGDGAVTPVKEVPNPVPLFSQSVGTSFGQPDDVVNPYPVDPSPFIEKMDSVFLEKQIFETCLDKCVQNVEGSTNARLPVLEVSSFIPLFPTRK